MSTIEEIESAARHLSPEERLHLLEAVRESLSATPEAIPLTSAQREELDWRLDELDREGPTGIPWDEVLHRVRERARR
jgi:putative addiction module component (TIGR02574 family)